MTFTELDAAIKDMIMNASMDITDATWYEEDRATVDSAATAIERLCAENAETLELHMHPVEGEHKP